MSCISVGRRRAAFTLIEVLVVVAIIALLIAIMMPSLRQAKEQSKVTVCLANLNTIGKAVMAYITNEKDKFPFAPGNEAEYPGGPWVSSSYYGGNSSATYYNPASYPAFAAEKKPINKYIYKSKIGSAIPAAGTSGPLRVFECPSDDGARWNQYLNQGLQEVTTCYQEIGTSYDENSIWYYYIQDWEIGHSGGAVTAANRAKREWQIVDRFVPIMRKKGASRAVVLYEDTADYALSTGMLASSGFPANYRVMGWHNKYDFASLFFLDGHSAYTSVDWRKVRPNPATGSRGHTATWAVHHDVGDN